MGLYAEIAQRLRSERERQRLSQGELARRLGVASNTVSRWETGTYKPKLEDLDKVARELGLGVGDLIPQNRRQPAEPLGRLLRLAESLSEEDLAELERFAEFRRAQYGAKHER